jgi:hypothetical protein
VWYSAHASFMVRLTRPKAFAAAILREDDDIANWNGEEKIWASREDLGAAGDWEECFFVRHVQIVLGTVWQTLLEML